MLNPLVSIIIPIYNGSDYMKEAIDSALNQTYNNIEIIVVNDGSNDSGKTKSIALTYGNKIRYFEKENGGVSAALNLAIKKMNGEYFSWLSHDDIYYPEKVQAEVEALKDCGDMKLPVYSDWTSLVMPMRKNVSHESLTKRFSNKFISSGLCATTMGFISGCSLLIHKSYFEKYGLFDESLRTTQDYMKWFQMFKDKRILYVDKVLVQSRIHEAQVGATYKNYLNECDELHLYMMKNVKESDVSKLGWSLYHFYSMMLSICIRRKFLNAYKFTYNQLLCLEEPKDIETKIDLFKNMLAGYCDDQRLPIYLYCAGIRGKALLKYFRLRDIEISGFIDSNPALWGEKIFNMKCFSPVEVDKKESLIIVTKANPKDLQYALQQDGFKYVTTYESLEGMLWETPILKKNLSMENHVLSYSQRFEVNYGEV